MNETHDAKHPFQGFLQSWALIQIRLSTMTNPVSSVFKMFQRSLLVMVWSMCMAFSVQGQEVPITHYSTNSNGQVQLKVNSNSESYYLLKVRHSVDEDFDLTTSITIGGQVTTTITEPLGNYPIEHYQVLQYSLGAPADTDGDGIDDITEYYGLPVMSPLNIAPAVSMNDGSAAVDNMSTFNDLSANQNVVQWSDFLNGKKFVKFIIVDFHTSNPVIYFINSDLHRLHAEFAIAVGIEFLGENVKKGQIIYHPTSIANNGTLGNFAFNYSHGDGEDFATVQRTHELLAANMPFITNNLSYYITANNTDEYEADIALYMDARIPVLFESDLFAEVDYWGLNQTEGFGLFRLVANDEIPGPRDIVLYESLPNSLPRVAGIMSSVIQTPLSHVNLRAIQDGVPNAFIRDPLDIPEIAGLLDKYVYYNVAQSAYTIREATLEEVNAWYESIRPSKPQDPPLNLGHTAILPLDDISFSMHDGYGAKCANMATMRTFGFPEGTIQDGYGIPFHYYMEFMEFNNFFDEVELMLNNEAFIAERDVRELMLSVFRAKIKQASMPEWMMDDLAAMHASFPEGTSVRCRSSTNNEDLPGFSGAGLYDSKTQHPDEGHISKSIKQVYASLWNLRAFEERDFYRVNHFKTAMGVLCHPNFADEKVNGVGVSTDPFYGTSDTFYLNSQLGEDQITNPEAAYTPEEIILDRGNGGIVDYTVIQWSSLAPHDSLLMGEPFLHEIREYLSVVHDAFAKLYEAEDNGTFAMDIEYKITANDQLIIKQARPWVSYIAHTTVVSNGSDGTLTLFPNPANETITLACNACNLSYYSIVDITGRLLEERLVQSETGTEIQVDVQGLPAGLYVLSGLDSGKGIFVSEKFVKY